MKHTIFILIATLMGCNSSHFVSIQTCQMCGAQFEVQSNEKQPSTIEWCFYDGAYCDIGLDTMFNSDQEAFIKHCENCVGCRCAAYTPESWKALKNDANR
jgi:hypothetical protein